MASSIFPKAVYISQLMLCKNCKSEIDDKALVCFRCGYATSERKVEPVVLTEDGDQSRRRRWVPLMLAVVFIAVSGFFMTCLLYTSDAADE